MDRKKKFFLLKRLFLFFLLFYGWTCFLENTFSNDWFPSHLEMYVFLKSLAYGLFYLVCLGTEKWKLDKKKISWVSWGLAKTVGFCFLSTIIYGTFALILNRSGQLPDLNEYIIWLSAFISFAVNTYFATKKKVFIEMV